MLDSSLVLSRGKSARIKTQGMLTVLVVATCALGNMVVAMPANLNTNAAVRGGSESVEYYLYRMSNVLDFYFTEEVDESQSKSIAAVGPCRSLVTEIGEDAQSVDEVVIKINKSLGYTAAFRDARNPNVVHYVSSEIAKDRNGVMEQEVELTFKGIFPELLGSLNRQIKEQFRIASPSVGGEHEKLYDVNTQVDIKDAKGAVRDIITNFIPLSRYPRCLWKSATYRTNNQVSTEVQFLGPLPHGAYLSRLYQENESQELVRRPEFVPFVPFSQGILAYEANNRSPETIKAALKFVEDESKKIAPLQLRWTLLWIGNEKVVEGLPVLLDHLDYEYAPSPLLTERFPAYSAVLEIGKPAIPALTERLSTVENPTQLNLCCRLILQIQGREAGLKSIDAILATPLKTEQKARLAAAIRSATEDISLATIAPLTG